MRTDVAALEITSNESFSHKKGITLPFILATGGKGMNFVTAVLKPGAKMRLFQLTFGVSEAGSSR